MYIKSKLQVCLLAMVLLVFSVSANAQCAMCRAALGGEDNNVQAQAVNDGIVYLMLIPYILVAVIGFAVYKLYSKKKTK